MANFCTNGKPTGFPAQWAVRPSKRMMKRKEAGELNGIEDQIMADLEENGGWLEVRLPGFEEGEEFVQIGKPGDTATYGVRDPEDLELVGPPRRRFADALAIQAGACNLLAVAGALKDACKEVYEEKMSTVAVQKDPAVRLIIHQMAFLAGVSSLDGSDKDYHEATEACARRGDMERVVQGNASWWQARKIVAPLLTRPLPEMPKSGQPPEKPVGPPNQVYKEDEEPR
jgi:hypothetical protein